MLGKIWFHTILFRWGKRILLWSHFRFPPNSNLSQKGAFLFKSPERYCSRHPPLPYANKHFFFFLHQLDLQTNSSSFMKKERRIGYIRYTDDMIIAIKSGVYFRKKIYNRFWKLVHFHYFTHIFKIDMEMSTF